MAKIAKTRIGTSYPIDICEGVPLFPNMGAVQLGHSFSHGNEKDILKKNRKRILLWRFNYHVQYVFITGICGPSYAATMILEGDINDTAVALNVSGDEAAAGIFMGMLVQFPITFGVESGHPRWSLKKGWSVKWKKSFTVSKRPEINILDLLVKLIKKILEERRKSNEIKKAKKLEGQPKENEKEKDEKKKKPKVSVGSWAIFDSIEGQYGAKKEGEMVPEPTLTITVNIVPMFAELEAVDKTLKALWGGFSLGPKFHFIVPVHIQMKRIAIDGAEISGLTMKGRAVTGTLPAPNDDPKDLHVELDHSTGLTFGTSFFMSVSVCKCFSFNPETKMLRLDALFGWEIKTPTHCTGFRNDIGNEDSPKPPIVECATQQVSVVLDP